MPRECSYMLPSLSVCARLPSPFPYVPPTLITSRQQLLVYVLPGEDAAGMGAVTRRRLWLTVITNKLGKLI